MLVAETASQSLLLVGNPNVGKSALFFRLTGRYVTVSNYPGTTIEVARGTCRLEPGRMLRVLDTPGTTSLAPECDDERAAATLIREADPARTAALVVADARNLRRGIALALEVGARGLPIALAVNMIDEACARGIEIDARALSARLGVPVALTAATRGEGIEDLRRAIAEARPIDPGVLVEGGGPERVLALAGEIRDAVARERPRSAAQTLAARFGRLATHPLWGWPILAVVLLVCYLVVGQLGAGVVVDVLQSTVFGEVDGAGLNGTLARASRAIGTPEFVHDLLFGEYGVVTMALTYALALILPIVGFFFIVFGILEDTGYLPRLAVVTNRAFSAIGLNGKAVLPMVLGLGCDTMATMATRILATRRERLIVGLLLALAVPCSAQLAVIFGLFAVAGGPKLLAVWLAIVVAVLLAAGFLAARLLPGETSDFIVELPPIRRPSLRNIARKTLARIEWYLKEAVPLFVLGTLLLFGLDRVGALAWITSAIEPLVTGLLGLPRECAAAFVVGFLRRDYGAVYLFEATRDGLLAPGQVLVATVTITLFLPCVASYFMLVREFGTRTALAVAGVVFTLAFGVGAAVNAVIP